MSTFWWSRDNLWNRIRYEMCEEGKTEESTRRLVPEVREWDEEIGVRSPVGAALHQARVGDEVDVRVPGGVVVIKVLSVV